VSIIQYNLFKLVLYDNQPLLINGGTIARRQFMRGTDPIKSTWVYPNLIIVICYNIVMATKYICIFYVSFLFGVALCF